MHRRRDDGGGGDGRDDGIRGVSLEDLRVFRRSRSCGAKIFVTGTGTARRRSASRSAARGAALVVSSVRDDDEVATEVKG